MRFLCCCRDFSMHVDMPVTKLVAIAPRIVTRFGNISV